MADQCIIIEGGVKYRDGRKWKPRWCVMRKLSPVADCVHLLLYRDARARWAPAGVGAGAGGAGGAGGGAGVKAALSLARCVGLEALHAEGAGGNGAPGEVGGEGHVLALLCRDAVHLLAFDTSQRLLQWQRAASTALRLGPSFPVRLSAGSAGGKGAAGGGGEARLHVSRGAAALAGGRPPRLLLVWDISALRRFGATGNKLVLEGGAGCGRGAGPHVLLTERAAAAAAALRAQAAAALTNGGGPLRPDSLRLSAGVGGGSDSSLNESGGTSGAGAGAGGGGALARCRSCMSKLGAPTAPAAPFTPAWTMPPLPRSCSDYRQLYDVPRLTQVEGEYYDTPKRLKECLGLEVPEGRVSPLEGHTSPSEDSVEGYVSPEEENGPSGRGSPELTCIERRPCGCVVRRRAARGEGAAGGRGGCACRRVTAWAQGWLRRRAPPAPAAAPLYATVDLSRKSRRPPARQTTTDYENVDIAPLYENGCALRERLQTVGAGGDDYLLMEPRVPGAAAAGYAPMSPPGAAAPRRASSPDVRGVGAGGAGRRASSAPAPPATRARDSSSSADSGVSLCSPPRHSPPSHPRSRSSDGGRVRVTSSAGAGEGKSSSAEAEVPVRGRTRGVGGSSSSASDTSDYIETLSLCSSHSSGEPPPPPAPRAATTLRPRAGAEYRARPAPSPAPSPAPCPCPATTLPHARY